MGRAETTQEKCQEEQMMMDLKMDRRQTQEKNRAPATQS